MGTYNIKFSVEDNNSVEDLVNNILDDSDIFSLTILPLNHPCKISPYPIRLDGYKF